LMWNGLLLPLVLAEGVHPDGNESFLVSGIFASSISRTYCGNQGADLPGKDRPNIGRLVRDRGIFRSSVL